MRKTDRELGMTQAEIDRLIPALGNLMYNIETDQYHYHDGTKYLLLSAQELQDMMDTPVNIEGVAISQEVRAKLVPMLDVSTNIKIVNYSVQKKDKK